MSSNTMPKLKTFMSPVYFRSPASPATIPSVAGPSQLIPMPGDKPDEQLCILDDLLGGGIAIPPVVLGTIDAPPDQRAPGLLLLLTGRPGSGKSTFALELCYRLAANSNPAFPGIAESGITSIYFSAEGNTSDLCAQAEGLGWDQSPSSGRTGRCILPFTRTFADPSVLVFGRDHVPQAAGCDPKRYFAEIRNRWDGFMATAKYPPRVVVFDSLNILPEAWDITEIMEQLVACCLRGPLLLIAILDSHWTSDYADRWSHLADITIDLSYEQRKDYMVRELQIIKARYQDHADGRHRLKVNGRPSPDDYVRHPMSPLIKEGGIFAFQSVHRALSRARRRSLTVARRLSQPNLPTPFAAFNSILGTGGMPARKCTAIVGSRGGMKSHLAYYTMLRFLRDPTNAKDRALLISLRDEEEPARDTLAAIMANQLDEHGAPWAGISSLCDARKEVERYLDTDRLETLFFWPGYISPEEFFHLVQVAIDRVPPRYGKPVSLVVINGLEQLSARFPLCAEEKMFVSGLVTMLTVCGATSVVVSGGEPGRPGDQGGVPEGLLQMADLILESSFQLLPRRQVWSDEVWADKHWSTKQREDVLLRKQYQRDPTTLDLEPHVVYQVVREPGARECRQRALFYMGRRDDPPPLREGSVEVRLLNDGFPYGERL